MENLEDAIAKYAAALAAIKDAASAKAQPALSQIINVLLARDGIQAVLNQTPPASRQLLAQLVQLDDALIEQAKSIIQEDRLAQCRQSLNPPESAWWWFLEGLPPKPQPQPKWAKYDWVWNLGTVVCLVVSTTFLSQTAKAFSAAEGFDLWGMFSTISQGAGLALVAGGALTDKGQKVVESALTSLKIPPYLHAEVTFAGALTLLSLSHITYSNLPRVGELYYEQGRKLQAENRWSEAQESYARSLNFIPDDPRISVSIGSIYEALGDFEKAIAEYEKGNLVGDPASMNALGRVAIWQAWEKTAWKGKIDADSARRADLLFERATKIVAQQTDDPKQQLLQAEIRTNQGILHWAKVGWNAQDALLDKIWLFGHAVPLEEAVPSNQHSSLSLSSKYRNQCYASVGDILHLASSQATPGVDPRVAYREFNYACLEIREVYQPGNWYDAKVIESAVDLQSVQQLIKRIQANVSPVKIADSKQISKFQQQLSAQIQQNLDPKSLPEDKIILRVFVNSKGKIIKYYAYDKMSQGLAYTTPIDRLWWDQKPDVQDPQEPLADFKVTFYNGAFEVASWSAKARGLTQNMTDPADMGMLKHCLFELLDRQVPGQFEVAENVNSDDIFRPSLVYKVNVTPDGAIADSQPMNKEAAERFQETPLVNLTTAPGDGIPLIPFKVEFKASNAFRITPWNEAENP
ncbi:tetratricopeptide repeat protein [Lusitaniella coriacea]|uniref:tetratricopeptide repeat protein n=1 Tax=Lusitaniella coriacea TaxID=1983105 RepID=UPI003CF6225E